LLCRRGEVNTVDIQEIKCLLEAGMATEHVTVSGDGYHHEVLVVSPAFDGLRLVKRQQMVYAVLNAHIADGSLHAINMKTLTPAEYAAAR
jgi:acid stress-induced BolA-like protein IbaG/YrbA